MNTQKKTFFTASEHRGERIMLSFVFQGIGLFVMLALISCIKNMIGLEVMVLRAVTNNNQLIANNLGVLGSMLSHVLIIDCFGVSALMIPILFFIIGAKLLFPTWINFNRNSFMAVFLLFWTSLAIDYCFPHPTTIQWYNLTGHLMHHVAAGLRRLVGVGLVLFLVLSFIAFMMILVAGILGKNKTLRNTKIEPMTRNGLIPPYKTNRSNYYGGGPHAELTGAYFTTQRSFAASHATTERKPSVHTRVPHMAVQEAQNTQPTTSDYTHNQDHYPQEVPHYVQPSLIVENDPRSSGYKAANLIFANHNHDE